MVEHTTIFCRFKDFCHKRIIAYWPLHVLVIGYIIVLGTIVLIRHYSFDTSAWDLGIFSQACYNTVRGRVLYYTTELYANPNGSILGVHFSPILLFVIPFYAIVQLPETLLIIQTIILAIGVYPVFFLAQHVIGDRRFGYYFSILYVMYPHLYSINIFDFHPDAFFVLFTLLAVYFFIKGKWKLYFAFIFLGMMTKEFMSIIIAAFAIGELLISRKEIIAATSMKKRFSTKVLVVFATLFVSMCWYFVAKFLIRMFNPSPPTGFAEGSPWAVFGGNPLDPFSWLSTSGINLLSAIKYDYQSKLFYLVTILAPLGFLPILKTLKILPVLLWVSLAFLSNYPPYYSLGYQYSALIVPFAIFAAIEGFNRVQIILKLNLTKLRNIFGKLLLVCILTSLALTFLMSPLQSYELISGHDQKMREVLGRIRQDFPTASILTQYDLFPHVSNMPNSYVIPPVFPAFNRTYYFEYVKSLFDMNLDFVILDFNPDARTHAHRLTYQFAFENLYGFKRNYTLYMSVDGVLVYKHGYIGNITFLEPFILNMDYRARIDTDTVLFSSVFPPGVYNITYNVKFSPFVKDAALTLKLTQGSTILECHNVSMNDFVSAENTKNFAFTMNITNPCDEVMFWISSPSLSTEIFLESMEIILISYSANWSC